MEWYEIEVDGRRTIKFPSKATKRRRAAIAAAAASDDSNNGGEGYGGIIKRGEWAWLAQGCTLHIVSLRNGQIMSSYEFADAAGYEGCSIRCVEELQPCSADSLLLAVSLVSFRGPSGGGSFVALFSVEHSAVLRCVQLPQHVTCLRFLNVAICRRSLLHNFDGCLAVGCEEGVVLLLDLNVRQVLAGYEETQQLQADGTTASPFVPCHIAVYNLGLTEMHRHFRQCQQDGVMFGLRVEVIESPCSIQCILPIDLILGFAIGLEDGRMALYDLAELQIFYITMPQQEQEMSPLMKMEFLLPPDDPRPCLYVWALHEGEDELTAVLHSFMYEKRLTDVDDYCYFETFQTSSVRLQLTLESSKCLAISCQSILTVYEHQEEDSNCLCALTWYSEEDEKNKLMIFDLNQWYKEEMPFSEDQDSNPSYLAGYILNGQESGLHAYLNASTIAHFNSMQRFEEHFYPNSLSFDCTLLLPNACRSYNWEGAQNKVINILRSSHATIFLEPDPCFNEILRTRLMPQFSEMNLNATFSRTAKYAIILSVALENNCFSLLRDCAKCWADGSFVGNFTASTGLSLSTLTEWIWQRANDIKTRCNDLCKGLFDFGGYPLDQREQKELGFITRQLKLLADLLAEVLIFSKRSIPDKVFATLDSRHNSLRMAAEYQDVLLWLLNIGLLPEASPYRRNPSSADDLLVPYPYAQLKETYVKKRTFFAKISEAFISKQSGSCRLLYIDAFIEHECKGKVLRDYWLEHHDGDGLYPPASIESMLRVMLVPDVGFDSKCAILLYFFLDLHQAIDEQAYKSVVANFIKFPSVFKLSASLIKTVQAFWNLDHGHFLPAVDEFISPFNNNQNYPQWLLELLIETLLTQNAANLALRILEARPTLISPVLKLKTLLSNELISEAFHFARSARQDDALLELFFSCCLCAGKFSVIRDLALSEHEGQLVQKILKRSNTQGAENLHFVYLLQKSKYIEAVSYMDELSTKSKSQRSNFGAIGSTSNMDTPNLVLSAFNTTMTPVTQGLTDVYFRIKNKIKKKEADNKSPVPLSCQLIKQNANNLLGGIYHSSALSAHFATYYWGGVGGPDMDQNQKRDHRDDSSNLLSCSNNAPFLRKPQIETHYLDFLNKNVISYPQTYQATEKRTLADSELQNMSGEEVPLDRQASQQNPKKRRRLLGRSEIVNDLSHFMQMNKNSSRLNISEFSFAATTAGDNQTKINTDVVEPLDSFLTRPLTKRRLSQEDEQGIKSLDATEIHSILKTNTPEIHGILKVNTPERSSSRREINTPERTFGRRELLAHEEEKSLRFSLPVEKHKAVTRSISTESSSSSTSKPTSEENFYSPVSSQNASMVIDSAAARTSSLFDASACLRSANKYRNLSGPLPRKPLERLSAERLEKSQTPELSPNQQQQLNDIELSPQSNFETVTIAKISDGCTEISPTLETQSTHLSSVEFSTENPLEIESLQTESMVVDAKTSSYTSISTTMLKISGVTSLTSKITEFIPQVSSSKVCETQSQFVPETLVKLSEASTIVGGLTYMESAMEASKDFGMPNAPHVDDNFKSVGYKMLDTTLGMSSYDLTICGATSPPIGQQLINPTVSAQSTATLQSQPSTSSSSSIKDLDEDEDESDLYNEALGISGKISSHELDIDEQSDESSSRSSASKDEESDDNAVIVLSSSASSNSSEESRVSCDSEEVSAESDERSESPKELVAKNVNKVNYDEDDEEEDEDDDDEEEDEIKEIDNDQITDEDDSEKEVDDYEELLNKREESDEIANEVVEIVDINDDENTNGSNVTNVKDGLIFEKLVEKRVPPSVKEQDVNIAIKDNQNSLTQEQIRNATVQSSDVVISTEVEDNKEVAELLENQFEQELEEKISNVNVGADIVATEIGTQDYTNQLIAVEDVLEISENLPDQLMQIEDEICTSKAEQKLDESVSENKKCLVKCVVPEPVSDITMNMEFVVEIDPVENLPVEIIPIEVFPVENQPIEINPIEVEPVKVYPVEVNVIKSILIADEKNNPSYSETTTSTENATNTKDMEKNDVEFAEPEPSSNITMNMEFVVESEPIENQPTAIKPVEVEATEVDPAKVIKNVAMTGEINIPSCSDVVTTSKENATNTNDVQKSLVNNFTMNMEFVVESGPVKINPVKFADVDPLEVDAITSVEANAEVNNPSSSDVTTSKENTTDAKDVQISESQTTEEEISLHVEEDDFSETEVGKLEHDLDKAVKEATGEIIKVPAPQSDNVPSEQETQMENNIIGGNEKKEKSNPIIKTPTLNVVKVEERDEAGYITRKIITKVTRSRTPENKSTAHYLEQEIKETSVSTPHRRNTRGISVPPQTQVESEDTQMLTPQNRRNMRASSLQPKSHFDYDGDSDAGTPRTRRNLRGVTVSPENAGPTDIVPAKITTRRRSVLQLDAITEDAALDSPWTRTRSRVRLNSMDSELDASIISGEQPPKAKRTRRTSVSSSVSEQQPIQSQTAKRTRRKSVTNQDTPGGSTPRSLRGRSIASNAAEEENEMDVVGKPITGKRSAVKRKKSTELDSTIDEEDVEKNSTSVKAQKEDETEDDGKKKKLSTSPNIEQPAGATSSSYSSSRRLTRTQLAMLEKSSAAIAARASSRTTTMSPTAKRMSKRSTSRSTSVTANQDSDDDGDSISSHQSNFSIPASKRRVTRSSVKDKDEVDDDLASVASSIGSETRSKRRSKEKNSPNTTLSAIPEDASEAHVEPKKRGRPPKK